MSALALGESVLHEKVDMGFRRPQALWQQLVVPFAALVVGLLALLGSGRLQVFGKILVYFGSQTFMNLYMKVVLSGRPINKELGLLGFPAAFMVTGIQQVSSFLLLVLAFGLLWCSPWRYTPTIIKTRNGWLTVLAFSVSFTLNIALNNFSLALLPISVNLIIRSCSPLSTWLAQQGMSRFEGKSLQDAKPLELACMVGGVVCAAVAVVAKSSMSTTGGSEAESSANLILGVVVCLASTLSGSLNMALAGFMGTSLSLNPIDTTLYMSIPSFSLLLLPAFLIKHPSDWPGNAMTDLQVLVEVAKYAPGVIGLAFLSGAFALCHNALTYFIVQSLSATHAAFASNFNKAATIGIALLVGLETMVFRGWGIVLVFGIFGNILAFTAYSVLKADDTKKVKH